jgi:hypothetical protein
LWQVTPSLLLVIANGGTFSPPIDLLVLILNFNTSHIIIYLELVTFLLMTFNLNLMFGNSVLWAMSLGRSLGMEPSTVLFPMSGNVKLTFPSMTLDGWFTDLKQRKPSFRFLVEDLI